MGWGDEGLRGCVCRHSVLSVAAYLPKCNPHTYNAVVRLPVITPHRPPAMLISSAPPDLGPVGDLLTLNTFGSTCSCVSS